MFVLGNILNFEIWQEQKKATMADQEGRPRKSQSKMQ